MTGKDFTEYDESPKGKFTRRSELLIRKLGDPDSPAGFGRTNLSEINGYINFDKVLYDNIKGFNDYYQQLASQVGDAISSFQDMSALCTFDFADDNNAVLNQNAAIVSSVRSLCSYTLRTSAALNQAFNTLTSISANWNNAAVISNALTTITPLTGTWNSMTTFSANSAVLDSVYSTTPTTSTQWESVYTTVSTSSAGW